MQDKIKKLQAALPDIVARFRDVRFTGLVLFAVVVLLISWSGVKVIETNYQLQRQIAQLKQENSVQQLKNDNIRLQNTYYNTDQYLELSARQNFGLGAPGEKLLLVPKNVALAFTVSPPAAQAAKSTGRQSSYAQHWQAWINFFLHRQSAN